MGLAWYLHIVYGILLVTVKRSTSFPTFFNNSDALSCPDYGDIDFGTIKRIKPMDMGNYPFYAIHIECNPGYELIGSHKLMCEDYKWEPAVRPECVALCVPPPDIENGNLAIEIDKNNLGMLSKGTLAIYSCKAGYKLIPPESKYRVCEKGIWTGATAECVSQQQVSCKQPRDIANGYYVQEMMNMFNGFGVGQRLHYSCNSGYALDGQSVQQCLDDGSWSPRLPPSCTSEISDPDMNLEYPTTCPELPFVESATYIAESGQLDELGALSGTKVEYRCERGYRNTFPSTCDPTILRCFGGVWEGDLPNCRPVKDCPPPPTIANGHILGRISRSFGTEVIYQCLPGFELRGKSLQTCSLGGCWEPLTPPSCHQLIDEYMNTSGTLLVSIATASGVMLILLAVCLVIVCRRRKPWGRQPLSQAGTAVPHHPTVSTGDSTAALIHDPDRLALIAFADGLQAGEQSVLPSYEEATRERTATTGGGNGAGLLGYRPHRPHWSALSTGRRGRPPGANQQNGDMHVTRQSSCTSHSASMRSGSAGDPMGSTDTMTPSEVSTNVTLDTVSSHSGSQPASCRAICGSLASFDTSSVHNTEGVPLLEENEAEETPTTDTCSIGVDHRSMSDNASFKYRRASPDLA